MIKNGEKMDELLEEGEAYIDAFFQKKLNRVQDAIERKKEIELARIKEDFELMKNRRKEDILFEKKLKIEEFKEAIELRILNKKLNLKNHDEILIREKEEFITLDEDSDTENELNNSLEENEGNNLVKNLFQYLIKK